MSPMPFSRSWPGCGGRLRNQRHDGARDQVPVGVEMDGVNRLDVEDVLRILFRPDVEVGVVLERQANHVSNRVLRRLRERGGILLRLHWRRERRGSRDDCGWEPRAYPLDCPSRIHAVILVTARQSGLRHHEHQTVPHHRRLVVGRTAAHVIDIVELGRRTSRGQRRDDRPDWRGTRGRGTAVVAWLLRPRRLHSLQRRWHSQWRRRLHSPTTTRRRRMSPPRYAVRARRRDPPPRRGRSRVSAALRGRPPRTA